VNIRQENRNLSKICYGENNKKQGLSLDNPCFLLFSIGCLAYTTRHLQLDQAVEFDRVLHWQLFGDRLDEAVDD
jgi:hypothetical protein